MSFDLVLGKQSQSDYIHSVFKFHSTILRDITASMAMLLRVRSTSMGEKVLSEHQASKCPGAASRGRERGFVFHPNLLCIVKPTSFTLTTIPHS